MREDYILVLHNKNEAESVISLNDVIHDLSNNRTTNNTDSIGGKYHTYKQIMIGSRLIISCAILFYILACLPIMITMVTGKLNVKYTYSNLKLRSNYSRMLVRLI